MQSKRLWRAVVVTGLVAVLVWLVTDRPGESEDLAGVALTIPEIGDRLAAAGLGCGAVIRNEPPEPDDQAEHGPVESALCTIGGTDELDSEPVAALILVYDVDRSERVGEGIEPPGHALIYGDRWEVWVPAEEPARAVADVLGGDLRLPDEFAGPTPSAT